MVILQGCAPWRTLLKLPAIYTGDSLARWQNLRDNVVYLKEIKKKIINGFQCN